MKRNKNRASLVVFGCAATPHIPPASEMKKFSVVAGINSDVCFGARARVVPFALKHTNMHMNDEKLQMLSRTDDLSAGRVHEHTREKERREIYETEMKQSCPRPLHAYAARAMCMTKGN